MRNVLVMRFLSRSAPIALFAAFGAGCSSDVARFSDPFSNPFKSRPQSYAQQSYEPAPATTASVSRSALPSADDVVRTRPRQAYDQAQSSYNNYQQQARTGAAVYGYEGKAAYQGAATQAQSAYNNAGTQVRNAAQAPVNRVKSAIPNDWQNSAAKASPFSSDNSDAGLATGSIGGKPSYNWKPGTPYLKQMMMTRPQTGGWTATGGTTIRVGQGETVASLSNRYGVPAAAIAQSNGINASKALVPGQTIVIPTYSLAGGPVAPAQPVVRPQSVQPARAVVKAPAPAQAYPVHNDGDITASIPQRPVRKESLAGAPMPKPNSARLAWMPQHSAPQGTVNAPSASHTVMMGESVNSIARRYNVTGDQLAQANGLGPDRPLRIGQTLRIPASSTMTADASLQAKAKASVAAAKATPAGRMADHTATASIARPAVAKPVVNAAAEMRQQPSKVVARADEPVRAVAPPSPTVAANVAPNFRWPVKGRIIGNFIPGQRDGIAMAVPEGTTVRASDDGVVAYSGNELKGYGNVVLIRHPSGYVTAYAHNSELLVKRGDAVKRGQVISLAGQTGGVSTPQLHFEIRKGQDAVNPMAFLKN